jgi:hypothetical protein
LPLWTAAWSADAAWSGKNYGNLVLNVVKVSLKADVVIKDTHVGFVLPRGAPFMADTGNNEVKVATSGAFQCWMYGNYMPNAAIKTNYAEALVTAEWIAVIWPQAWIGVKGAET